MPSSLNRVQLIGHLGADPESRYTPSNTCVTNVRLATSESWTDKQTGEKKERTEWHRIVCFGRLAEVVAEHLHKGDRAMFEGRLETQKWQDQNGNDRYTTQVNANSLIMLGQARGGGGRSDDGNGWGDHARQEGQRQQRRQQEPPPGQGDFDDDIPF